MANREQLEIARQGSTEWNKWRSEHPDLYTDLRGAHLRGADLRGIDFRETNLRGASLAGADLSGADLRAGDFAGSNLALANLTQADLARADISGCVMDSANLTKANLRGASLREASLTDSIFCGANISAGSVISGEVGIRAANISEAGRPASTRGEFLGGANLRGTILRGADFSGAWAGGTTFADIDLSEVGGLETIHHLSASTIGIDTIFKSRGNIPNVFLRGCGVPDEMISFIKSVAGAIQFYSCFISYSTKDQEFADRLYADLQNKGVRCWFAPHDIKGGRKLHEQLDEAIRVHDKLLLILSEDSMNSDWVKTEILKARKREVEENRGPLIPNAGMSGAPVSGASPGRAPATKPRQMLFPISLVPYEVVQRWEYPISTGMDLAEEIRQYFIPDFSNWKDHDSYQQAFQRLVSDLKAESRSDAG